MAKYKQYKIVAKTSGVDLRPTFLAFSQFLLRKTMDKGPIALGSLEACDCIRFKIRRGISSQDLDAFTSQNPDAEDFELVQWED